MKPPGHEATLKFAARFLERTLKERFGLENIDLSPLFLGNWLTDVAQVILPTYKMGGAVRDFLSRAVESLFDQLTMLLDDKQDDGALESILKKYAPDLQEFSVKFLWDAVLENLEGQGRLILSELRPAINHISSERDQLLANPDLRSSEETIDFIRTVRELASVINENPSNDSKKEAAQIVLSNISELGIISEILDLCDRKKLLDRLESLKAEANQFLESLFPDDRSKKGIVQRKLTEFFQLLAYFKFVHKKNKGAGSISAEHLGEMVSHYFQNSWTYFHLDRAPSPTKNSQVSESPPPHMFSAYESKFNWKNITGFEKQPYRLDVSYKTNENDEALRGTYTYVLEDLSLACGELYQLEKDWVLPFFVDNSEDISNENKNWVDGLSRLGVCLHTFEDYFAHSNFVEHAAALDWDNRTRYMSDEQKSLILKRLKKWSCELPSGGDPSWESFPGEADLVTGYFDCIDLGLSLLHSLLDTFLDTEDAASLDRELMIERDEFIQNPVYEISKVLREASAIIMDPKKATEDITNELAQNQKEFIENYFIEVDKPAKISKSKIRKLLLREARDRESILHELEDTLITLLVNTVELFVYLFKEARMLLRYLILIVKLIFFVRTALLSTAKGSTLAARILLHAIRNWLPEAIEKELTDYLRKFSLHEIIKLLKKKLGAERIGSHSLIAKDDNSTLFYSESVRLAQFTNTFILMILLRLAPIDTEQEEISGGTLLIPKWEDVLEYIFDHPFNYYRELIPKKVEEVGDLWIYADAKSPRTSTLKSIAITYAKSANIPNDQLKPLNPYGYSSYDWRVIADANFPTWGMPEDQAKATINAVLEERGGHKVGGVNYAFNTGTPVRVPFQLLKGMTFIKTEKSERDWWKHVLDLPDLVQLENAMTEWTDQRTRMPFYLDYSIPYHTFSRSNENEIEQLERFFESKEQNISKLRAWRTKVEEEAAQSATILECMGSGCPTTRGFMSRSLSSIRQDK